MESYFLSLLWIWIKAVLAILIWFVIYKVYELLILPWIIWKEYAKYPNVLVRKKFYPPIGDVVTFCKNERENKDRIQAHIDIALNKNNTDIKLVQFGPVILFSLCSPKALNEFEKLIPEKLDRFNHNKFLVGNIAPNSIILMQSNRRWDKRRKAILKTIGINFVSKYIPMMTKIVDEWIDEVSIGADLDLSFELNKITFRIITKILFGRDIDKMDKCVYISPINRTKQTLNFEECYFRYFKNEFDSHLSVIGKIFSPLAKLSLIEPFKSNTANKKSIDDTLRVFFWKRVKMTNLCTGRS